MVRPTPAPIRPIVFAPEPTLDRFPTLKGSPRGRPEKEQRWQDHSECARHVHLLMKESLLTAGRNHTWAVSQVAAGLPNTNEPYPSVRRP